ncbi:portal protein, partial [Acetobacter oryzifermentans]
MDWQELQKTILVPQQVSARAKRLLRLSAVRDGTMYDALPYPFSEEWNNNEYIPLSQRRPSVRSHLCAVVVEDAASLTFGETHWPTLKCENSDTADALSRITRECQLPAVLMEAVLKGSIGSVAVLVEAVGGALSVSVLDTPYLEPEWDAKGDLARVVSQYLIKGHQVRALGYDVSDGSDGIDYWYRREWTRTASSVYKPWPASSDANPEIDAERSGPPHGLGFVPIVWVRNLAPPSNDPDGVCTFERAIDTVIEGDYQLSQVGRGLKYCSDPKLVITGVGGDTSGGDGAPASEGGSATAIVLPEKASAKMLEING